MSDYNAIASDRLTFSGEYRDVDRGVREFMIVLCKLEQELLDFETEVTQQDIGLTGWTATQEIGDLEDTHNEYVSEIRTAYKATVNARPTQLDRNPGEEYHNRTKQYVNRHQTDFLEMVQRLEEVSDRIGRRLDSKRNTANTRLILTVSAIAAVVSMVSLVGALL